MDIQQLKKVSAYWSGWSSEWVPEWMHSRKMTLFVSLLPTLELSLLYRVNDGPALQDAHRHNGNDVPVVLMKAWTLEHNAFFPVGLLIVPRLAFLKTGFSPYGCSLTPITLVKSFDEYAQWTVPVGMLFPVVLKHLLGVHINYLLKNL